MIVEVLERGGNSVRLLVKGASLHVINSIRRAAMAEVPTMAIDYVVFTENSSVFYDEYIAHRLGLIPLTSEAAIGKYKPPEECAEAGERGLFSEDCFAKFELSGEGPPDGIKTLYSSDLVSSDPDVRPVYDRVPIVQLIAGQRIRLEAYARLGRGREHIKWSPVSVASHKYIADISLRADACAYPSCRKCIDACPRGVIVEGGNKPEIRLDKIYECSLCRLCETVCPNQAIRVSWREGEYILYIETTGTMSPKRVLVEASKILVSKLEELKKRLTAGG